MKKRIVFYADGRKVSALEALGEFLIGRKIVQAVARTRVAPTFIVPGCAHVDSPRIDPRSD